MKGKYLLSFIILLSIFLVFGFLFLNVEPSHHIEKASMSDSSSKVSSWRANAGLSPSKNELPKNSRPFPSSNQQKSIEDLMLLNEVINVFNNFKKDEARQVRYLETKKGKLGRQQVAIIPAVSQEIIQSVQEKLDAAIGDSISVTDKSLRLQKIEQIMSKFSFNKFPRCVAVSLNEVGEGLDANWFDVEKASDVHDQFQYIDYGNIISNGFLTESQLVSRYGHLFKFDFK